MKKSILWLILLYAFSGNAQSLFREGFIVTNSGDSIPGMIRDEEWKSSPTSIQFKQNGRNVEGEFSVDQIKAFFTDRQVYYERVKVKYDGEPIAINGLAESREPKVWKEGIFFLETLVKSDSLSLYELEDDLEKTHYILTDGKNKSQELLYRKYKANVNGSQVIVTSKQWQQQLMNEMASCPTVSARVKSSDFTESKLKSLVGDYNKCVGVANRTLVNKKFTPKKRPPTVFIVLNGFTHRTSLSFASTQNDHINFGGGLAVELYSRKKPNRLSLYNEVKFINLNQTAINDFGGTPVDFKMNMVNLTSMVRGVFFLSDKIKIYGKLGILGGYRFGTFAVNKINGFDLASNNRSGLLIGIPVAIGTEFLFLERTSFLEFRLETDQRPKLSYNGTRYGLAMGIKLF